MMCSVRVATGGGPMRARRTRRQVAIVVDRSHPCHAPASTPWSFLSPSTSLPTCHPSSLQAKLWRPSLLRALRLPGRTPSPRLPLSLPSFSEPCSRSWPATLGRFVRMPSSETRENVAPTRPTAWRLVASNTPARVGPSRGASCEISVRKFPHAEFEGLRRPHEGRIARASARNAKLVSRRRLICSAAFRKSHGRALSRCPRALGSWIFPTRVKRP